MHIAKIIFAWVFVISGCSCKQKQLPVKHDAPGRPGVMYISELAEKPDYCTEDTLQAATLIGRKVKIWSEAGVYPVPDLDTNITWPSEEIKVKASQSDWGSYRPAAGDTGIIVHVFPPKSKQSGSVYLLRIGDNYVPVACYYLIDPAPPAGYGDVEQFDIEDPGEPDDSGACSFKLPYVKGRQSRAGSKKIDIISESFACDLVARGIDTVMLCKYIPGKGSSPEEKAFVLWQEGSQGYAKAFFNRAGGLTANKRAPFDACDLVYYFFQHRLDTVTRRPRQIYMASSFLGYSIQLYTPSSVFRDWLSDFMLWQDPKHPKVKWWMMISKQLGTIRPE